MTDQPDNTVPESGPETDPLRILLQTSAAAEALQQQFNELKSRRAELMAEQDQLNFDRTAFETRAREFAEQVARDRTTQREVTAELETRSSDLRNREVELEGLRQSVVRQGEDVDAKQERLHEAVNTEMARERELTQRQRNSLDEERERLAERTEDLERQHASRVQQVDELLKGERDAMRDSIRRELTDELNQLQHERREWENQKDTDQQELKEQAEDLQQQRELFGEQLETEHKRLREEIDKRRQALLSEQNNLQRRYRFQFEHLARAREDFEEELRELRREQQLFRSQRMEFGEQHRLRFAQLKRIRTALTECDESLTREQRVIDRHRVSTGLDLKRHQDRLNEHQAAVLQDLESRGRQLRQREEAAAETTRRVDLRLQHVNQLRAELDAKQQDILEQRLLFQEMQTDQSQVDERSPVYHQARQAVELFFEQLHQPLRSESDRLERQAVELSERQEQFRQDRHDLERWFAEQEKMLAADPQSPSRQEVKTEVAQLQQEIADLRTEWNRERRESEARLRQLNDQLTRTESDNIGQQSSGNSQKSAA